MRTSTVVLTTTIVWIVGGIALPVQQALSQETGNVQQRLQQLGAEAAQKAKTAEEAAQKAEALANKLAGTPGQGDAQDAAKSAREHANTAKADADQIQQQAQGSDSRNLEQAQDTTQDVQRSSDQAQDRAQRLETTIPSPGP